MAIEEEKIPGWLARKFGRTPKISRLSPGSLIQLEYREYDDPGDWCECILLHVEKDGTGRIGETGQVHTYHALTPTDIKSKYEITRLTSQGHEYHVRGL